MVCEAPGTVTEAARRVLPEPDIDCLRDTSGRHLWARRTPDDY